MMQEETAQAVKGTLTCMDVIDPPPSSATAQSKRSVPEGSSTAVTSTSKIGIGPPPRRNSMIPLPTPAQRPTNTETPAPIRSTGAASNAPHASTSLVNEEEHVEVAKEAGSSRPLPSSALPPTDTATPAPIDATTDGTAAAEEPSTDSSIVLPSPLPTNTATPAPVITTNPVDANSSIDEKVTPSAVPPTSAMPLPTPATDTATPAPVAATAGGTGTDLPAAPAAPPKDGATVPFVTCTEKDVLMGRGKRVSEWPGNIQFRAIIAKYRPAYLQAPRHQKVEIAAQVIQDVKQQHGGRFLREVDPSSTSTGLVARGQWVVVDPARVTEKTCQALREKEKIRTANGTVIKKRRLTAEEETEQTLLLEQRRKFLRKNPEQVETTADHHHTVVWSMLVKLEAFHKQHGHSAVQPNWSDDRTLADWVSAQRQLFADVQAGKRTELSPRSAVDETTATVHEEAVPLTRLEQHIVDELRKLDFVTDYDAWHWNRSFDECKASGLETMRPWVHLQQKCHREGALSEDRRKRLEDLGVSFLP